MYSLKSIIIHSGTAECGHFFTFLKIQNKWYCLSDSHVQEWTQESVLLYAKGKSRQDSQANAYCLFYIKSNSILLIIR